MKKIKAFAPATVANVACGFDVLGFALDEPGDTVEIEINENSSSTVLKIEGDEGMLPTQNKLNTITLVIWKYLAHIKREKLGLNIKLTKGMPLKSGLGSSAASSVVGVYALNKLLGEPLTQAELLPFAMEGERLACGSAHADNVAPALMGGFVLVRSYDPLDIVELPTPSKLYATVIHPHIEVKTQDARSILRKEIQLKEAVNQWGNLGGLIAGIYKEDYGLIGRSLTDSIVEPVRSLLIPGFDKAKAEAIKAGALGCSISGSGPSIFALSDSPETAQKIADNMQNVYNDLNIQNEVFISKVNSEGPKIID